MRNLNPKLIFLEATDAALVRRFSETRRPHPLAPDRSVAEGIRDERARLWADPPPGRQILDTSAMTVHDLRQRVSRLVARRLAAGRTRRHHPELRLQARNSGRFGFTVRRADFCRTRTSSRRCSEHTGRDAEVVRFINQSSATGEFLDRTTHLLEFLVPQYVSEGKSYLTIGIGCTGRTPPVRGGGGGAEKAARKAGRRAGAREAQGHQ